MKRTVKLETLCGCIRYLQVEEDNGNLPLDICVPFVPDDAITSMQFETTFDPEKETVKKRQFRRYRPYAGSPLQYREVYEK
jgi:hypothetical protein